MMPPRARMCIYVSKYIYSSLLYFTMWISAPEIPGNALYPAFSPRKSRKIDILCTLTVIFSPEKIFLTACFSRFNDAKIVSFSPFLPLFSALKFFSGFSAPEMRLNDDFRVFSPRKSPEMRLLVHFLPGYSVKSLLSVPFCFLPCFVKPLFQP